MRIHRLVALAKTRGTRKGRVIATGDLLHSPFGGHACVMYEVEILRISGSPICERKATDFIIENDSGHTLIRANEVVIKKRFDLVIDDPDPTFKSVLAKYGLDYEDWRIHKILRCQERIVLPGQFVEIRGFFNEIDTNPRILELLPETVLALHA
jgi:hypothetical protein